jgi:hypothetical protein
VGELIPELSPNPIRDLPPNLLLDLLAHTGPHQIADVGPDLTRDLPPRPMVELISDIVRFGFRRRRRCRGCQQSCTRRIEGDYRLRRLEPNRPVYGWHKPFYRLPVRAHAEADCQPIPTHSRQ